MKISDENLIKAVNSLFLNNSDGSDMFKPRTMLKPFIKRSKVSTFFIDNFFDTSFFSKTEEVIMDFQDDEGSEIAPFIYEGIGTINKGRKPFSRNMYKTPCIGINKIYDKNIGERLLPGESEYSGMTPAERIAILYAMDYAELNEMILGREELMCSELLQTGIITIDEYAEDRTRPVNTVKIEFDKNKREQLTGKDEWTNPDADIYGILERKASELRACGSSPETIIMGQNAWNCMLKNKPIQDLLKNMRIRLGFLSPSIVTNKSGKGYSYLGNLGGAFMGDIDVYTYINNYVDPITKELKPYLDPDTVIIAPKHIGEIIYGAITIIPSMDTTKEVTYTQKRVAKLTVNHEDNVKKLHLYSRPLPKISDVKQWASLKVVV